MQEPVQHRPSLTDADLQFDRDHIWHPYTSLADPLPSYPIVAAAGCELELADGRRLVDGMASWWAAIHGYNHAYLNAAATEQLQHMSHVMFGGITHPPAVALARQLVAITPASLDAVFFADSGSVAVEVAIKMAIQYWVSLDKPQKNRLVTIKRGYHGDTFAAMSVCDPVNGMHGLFQGAVRPQLFADAPELTPEQDWQQQDIASLTQLLEQQHQQIAALILEPIVQGAGGMRFYHPEYLRQARRLCDHYQVLLIADEIATGFGRTGRLFACQHADIEPDIMCLGKALTGGYMTLAAVMTQRHVANTIGQGNGGGALMHGPTFMGNPLACAVANASLALLTHQPWQLRVHSIEQQLRARLLGFNRYASVADARVLGAIGVVEMQRPVNVAALQKRFVEAGVWIRPFGKLIYIMPPYVISRQQLERLLDAIEMVVSDTD
ncbi:adenosylmethionine--8-amino-7-oxononanoate transaminase [Idiomarina xiamenensis]|uniref:Adenosylmethionine-8-amino-7-oxononanoate aminotransferase n=1 Tax=Idiomarina xiamenensis 10-D-4 TaxID=740709 RepID=K2KWU4_9GAMM|nr:adenosylmethionine--8-amino-7-oxononanoate transaminase [Idiomarina xiamenensis]EKE86969.1 adenosylmethionine--8-amino-7-oxononanoate transaminase [Idiomarina xiamenensis 10-D-4]